MNQLRKYFLYAAICLLLVLQTVNAAESAKTENKAETASTTVEDGGTGAFKAIMASDSSLSQFTIFRPADMSLISDKTKLPIIAWGNGGCANSPSGHLNFLSEVASHGYLVIAIGPMPQGGAGGGRGAGGGMPGMMGGRGGAGGGMPGGMMGGRGGRGAAPTPAPAPDGAAADGQAPGARRGRVAMPGGMMGGAGGGMPGGMMGGRGTRGGTAPAASDENAESQLIEAIDWAIAQDTNESSIYYGKLDTSKIAVAGMSCGGIQAYQAAPDERVSTVMICNSGLFGDGGGGMGGMPALPKSHLEKVHGSIIFILGGESDIAYANGMDDFDKLEKIPAFTANLPVGHGGTYTQPHGGDFAKVASAWLEWQLKGDKEAAKMFEGEPCGVAKMEGWTIQKKNIK
ncbi:MAG: hypothetical protein JXA96_17450 [Sedimentisphaerales bacterium]|nr:hypothetical protein [Sedimentisphaerales bacterium]